MSEARFSDDFKRDAVGTANICVIGFGSDPFWPPSPSAIRQTL